MFFGNWFKKEAPFQGLTGFGGGATSLSLGGGAAETQASGGSETTYTEPTNGNTYQSHKFTSPGNFVITSLGSSPYDGSFDLLIVGGGGGAGSCRVQLSPLVVLEAVEEDIIKKLERL